jgi:hypothetical protein
MINSCVLMATGLTIRDRLFDPVSLSFQVVNTPLIVYTVMLFSLAAAYLALWVTARDYRVFRGMSLYLAMCAVQMLWIYEGGTKSNWALVAVTGPVLIMIAGEAMRVSHRRWTLLIWPFSYFVLFAGWFLPFQFLQATPVDVSDLMLLVLVIQAFRAGQWRDRQIAAAFAFFLCIRATLSANFRALTHLPVSVQIDGWIWAIPPAAIILLGAATLVIYVRDLIQDRAEKQRLAAELAASGAVQQMLIPSEIPAIPGFKIESVYKPFGEVGGDFFQIIPLGNNAVLMVIGDVSGKGMPAALTVSLAVGALSLAVESSISPGVILSALNRALIGRNCGGFTTCLALRVDADGKLTFANAGHIAPYLAGNELPLENGLPLGLAAEATYPESTFQLGPNQQLTLTTDGVVESRDKTGALFGFERTAAISRDSAEKVAQAAQAFGQDDDITVLTLQRAVPA